MKVKIPDNVPTLFGQTARDWVDSARETAYKLLQMRSQITIEDVLAHNPRPSYIRKNVTGHIFQDARFRGLGYTLSKRPVMNSRVIRIWGLAEPPHVEYDRGD